MNKNVIIGVLAVLLAATAFVGYQQNKEKLVYKNKLENTFQSDFQGLLSSVKNIETNMSKAAVSSSNSFSTELLSNIWRQADMAQAYLSSLPLGHTALKDTESFLNKLSDFSYAMAKVNINGKELTGEQRDNLDMLKNSSSYLLQQLQVINEQVQLGKIKFGTDSKKWAKEDLQEGSENLVTKSFTSVEKEMVEYPKLIYDGPFSEHIQDIQPKWIEGEEITKEEGEKTAKEFIGEDNIENVESSGSNEGIIKTFVYSIKLKNQEESAYVEITKKGGHVLKVMKNRVPSEQKLSIEEAGKIADDFLKEKGYENLEVTYHEKYSNVGVFNYAYLEGDILVYPDLIKIQISLDNGEMLGLEAQGFHMAHHERNLEEPKISKEEAKGAISQKLEITNERMAIIPTEFKTEILCYEFKGTYKNEWFIVYINADTGKEQEILKIIEADESVLTL